MPEGLGPHAGLLAPCPSRPNCVTSAPADDDHRIPGLATLGSPLSAWEGLKALLAETEGVEVVTSTPDYLHVVYTSALMRYRDDVEFLLRPDQHEIAVRSASRVGYGDMGVNRSRIEGIRAALSEKGLVSPMQSD